MNHAHGQHVDRQSRTEEYRRWSGASLVDKDGQVKEASTEADPQVVEQEVSQIRNVLATLPSGLGHIRLDISHQPTVEAIKAALTEQERKCVVFGSEGEHIPV